MISKAVQWFCRSRRIIATGSVAIMVGLLFIHVIFGPNGMIVYHQKRQEYKSLETEIKSLEAENDRLNQRIKALKTDPKAIESEARTQLHYAKPGEVVYSLPTAPPPVASSTAKK